MPLSEVLEFWSSGVLEFLRLRRCPVRDRHSHSYISLSAGGVPWVSNLFILGTDLAALYAIAPNLKHGLSGTRA